MEDSWDSYSNESKLARTSEKFRKLFLLVFTKELIKHSKEEFFELEHNIKKEIKDKKNLETKEDVEREYEKFIPSLLYSRPTPKEFQEKPDLPPQIFKNKRPVLSPPFYQIPSHLIRPKTRPNIIVRRYAPLRIPEFPLPPTVQDVRPYPTNVQIDLGKLNPFIQDPAVRVIECEGPDINIVVSGNMGTRAGNLVLTKEDIEDILSRFSQASRIPLTEGIVKIVLGQLVLSAIVSEIIGSKFIIRKMAPPMPTYGFMSPGIGPLPRRGFY